VNPHKGRAGYEPLTGGMVAALPSIDHFVSGHSMAAFEELIWTGEYRSGLLPKGSHEFHKFINPSELTDWLGARAMRVMDIRGVAVDLSGPRVAIADSIDITYIGYATKQ